MRSDTWGSGNSMDYYYERVSVCNECGGTGYYDNGGDEPEICKDCEGKGEVIRYS